MFFYYIKVHHLSLFVFYKFILYFSLDIYLYSLDDMSLIYVTSFVYYYVFNLVFFLILY